MGTFLPQQGGINNGYGVQGDSPTHPKWGGDQSFEICLPAQWMGHKLVFRIFDGPDTNDEIAHAEVPGGTLFFTGQLGRVEPPPIGMQAQGGSAQLSVTVIKSDFANTIASTGTLSRFCSSHGLMQMRVSSVDDRKAKDANGATVYQVFSSMMMKIHNYINGIDAPGSNWDSELYPSPAATGDYSSRFGDRYDQRQQQEDKPRSRSGFWGMFGGRKSSNSNKASTNRPVSVPAQPPVIPDSQPYAPAPSLTKQEKWSHAFNQTPRISGGGL